MQRKEQPALKEGAGLLLPALKRPLAMPWSLNFILCAKAVSESSGRWRHCSLLPSHAP